MITIIRHDRRKQARKRTLLFVLSVVLIYGMFFSPMASFFSSVTHTVATPIWKTGSAINESLSPFLSYFSSRRELYLENKELKTQIESMVAKISDRNLLLKENKELKEILKRSDDRTRVLSIVLAKPDQTPYDTLVIDVGKKYDIKKGSLVLSENVVIGEIEEVFSDSSKATLFSSAGKEKIVNVGEDSLTATAHGLGGGNFEIQLPKNSNVSTGDTIYLPDIEPRIFGVVERIESGTKDAFERVLFKSPVNPFTLSKVEVVI